ncbi:MAG: Na+/H+ antiporter NhaA [Gammaproteobacteria bacterium]|nr:MAG: Na+/H+ antiporter NhaA [Gammaproteobacteria bacterium]
MSENTRLYFAPWERSLQRIATPFEEFLHRQTTTGVLLISCAVIALIIANSPLLGAYDKVLHMKVGLTVGSWSIKHSVHHWINDGLMAIFFFVIGLEIKREIVAGELASIKNATLPVVAAVGGAVVPAFFYWLLNQGTEGIRGWGIPMATDIAFAVGVLALLGRHAPKSLVTFLVALAIVDDLLAVSVIALFYTDSIHVGYLITAVGITFLLIALNLFGIRRALPYFVLIVFLWIAMEGSGIHATIAGIIGAWTIPAYARYGPAEMGKRIRSIVDDYDRSYQPGTAIINNPKQSAHAWKINHAMELGISPLQRLESTLHIPSAYLVIPLFALANAGIPLDVEAISQAMTNPIALGIVLGLVLGKTIGIAGSVLLFRAIGIGELPRGITPMHIIGVSMLAGIGFTMSIFISELAFVWDGELIVIAKTGVLFASLIAGIGGYLWLRWFGAQQADQPEDSSAT